MKKKKITKVKIPIYFDKVNDGPALAMLEHFRVLSKTELPMSKWIKFLAVEYCLQLDKAVQAEVEKEKENAKETEDKDMEAAGEVSE